MSLSAFFISIFLALISIFPVPSIADDMIEQNNATLKFLDKTTAQSRTSEVEVGSTINYGDIFIRVQACKKSSPMEKPESAAFLQIWEEDLKTEESKWVFSGWVFASSPALSPVDHPVYDVWLIDCFDKSGKEVTAEQPVNENFGNDEDEIITEELR